MYTSSEDDRSDLFLAAAVFVLGPELLGIIIGRIPIPEFLVPLVRLIVVVLTTVALPLWLMRYRKQRLSHLGFDGKTAAAGAGALVALPVVAAYVAAEFIGRSLVGGPTPAWAIVRGGDYVDAAVSVIAGLCVAFVAIYVTVKARTAFRADPAYIKPTMQHLGKFAAIAGGIAVFLLVVTSAVQGGIVAAGSEFLLAPLGVAAAGWLTYRSTRGSQLTSRATLLTPMILLAIGSIAIFDDALIVVLGLWYAALLAGIGLVVGALLENHRSAWAPMGFGAVVALLTPLLG